MLAELSVKLAVRLLGDLPPDGRKYWSTRWWDRDTVEATPGLRGYIAQHRQVVIELLRRHRPRGASDYLDVACGAGHSTELITQSVPDARVVAIDISEPGLNRATARLRGVNVLLRRVDFWEPSLDASEADVVVCLSAVHHLGNIPSVLARLRDFTLAGGIVIGNIWTADAFHEFERIRYGIVGHTRRSLGFLLAAIVIKLSKGRLRSGAYRTQLLHADKIEQILSATFADVVEFRRLRYHIIFVCRTASEIS